MVRQALLDRAHDSSSAEFEELVAALLSKMGFKDYRGDAVRRGWKRYILAKCARHESGRGRGAYSGWRCR